MYHFQLIRQRSNEKELLDLGSNYYTTQEYQHCQKVLFRINRLLGFYRDTKKILQRLNGVSSLVDIGCGGGLFVLHLSQELPHLRYYGIDISQEAIEAAKQELIEWKHDNLTKVFFQEIQSKYFLSQNKVDIILTTLTCHHMHDSELVEFLQEVGTAAKMTIINDLHRHFIPYWIFKILSPLFNNRLVTHDGPISIKRGFKRKDWQLLLQQAKIKNYKITWRFPFRWRLVIWNEL